MTPRESFIQLEQDVKGVGMIHFSCDRCQRELEEDEIRFTLSIEVQVALDPESYELDDASDPMIELQQILLQFDAQEREEISQFAYQRHQYDMCSECHREYLGNPLAIEAPAKVGFSEN